MLGEYRMRYWCVCYRMLPTHPINSNTCTLSIPRTHNWLCSLALCTRIQSHIQTQWWLPSIALECKVKKRSSLCIVVTHTLRLPDRISMCGTRSIRSARTENTVTHHWTPSTKHTIVWRIFFLEICSKYFSWLNFLRKNSLGNTY